MSKIEVDTIDTVTGTSTLQVGDSNTSTINIGASGDTINIPSGVTITNSGTATGFGGVNTPAFSVRRSTSQSFSAGAWTKIQFNTEEYDTDNVFDNSTNYRFTPTTAGKYQFNLNGGLTYSGTATINGVGLYKNGVFEANNVPYATMNSGYVLSLSVVVEFNGTGDYIEAYVYSNGTSPSIVSARQETFFQGFKIIE